MDRPGEDPEVLDHLGRALGDPEGSAGVVPDGCLGALRGLGQNMLPADGVTGSFLMLFVALDVLPHQPVLPHGRGAG